MLVYKIGDVLQATENIICHQVNEHGIMGGGLALQVATQYPKLKEIYSKYCEYNDNDYQLLVGTHLDYCTDNNKIICNCFTQENFVTDLWAIETCFRNIIDNYIEDTNNKLAIPYKYGCGIAKGNWKEVSKLFEDLSNEYGIDISIYKLREEI